jgi:hypothetical protein
MLEQKQRHPVGSVAVSAFGGGRTDGGGKWRSTFGCTGGALPQTSGPGRTRELERGGVVGGALLGGCALVRFPNELDSICIARRIFGPFIHSMTRTHTKLTRA